MKKKFLLLSLIALLCLPTLGITQDARVDRVEFKWVPNNPVFWDFQGYIWVTNETERDCMVFGKLVFYRKDQAEIFGGYFQGTVKAGVTAPLFCYGRIGWEAFKEKVSQKAIITDQIPIEP